MGRGMLLDFDDDDISDCSSDGRDPTWDTDSTSTDSFYAVHDLLGEDLPTIWELESYASSDSEREEDDDIASIASGDSSLLDNTDRFQLDDNNSIVDSLPSDIMSRKSGHSHNSEVGNNDDEDEASQQDSLNSAAGMEELWSVNENGEAQKTPSQDVSSHQRDVRRREIQAKMRLLEERISTIRGIVDEPLSPTPTPSTPQESSAVGIAAPNTEEHPRRGGRSRTKQDEETETPTTRRPRRGRRKESQRLGRSRSRSRSRSVSRSVSPPRTMFNDTLENRRKQMALAREQLHNRLLSPMSRNKSDSSSSTAPKSDSASANNDKSTTTTTNPRHLHRQMAKRNASGPRVPKRFRTA